MRRSDLGVPVVVDIPDDARDWGYGPIANGTAGVITGFSTIAYGYTHNFGKEPGIYNNSSWPWVKFGDTTINISTCHLTYPKDIEPAEDRKLAELPFTDFYPYDRVRWGRAIHHQGMVSDIDYDRIDSRREDGSSYPIYTIQLDHGGSISRSAEELELVERGNVWRKLFGLPLVFADLRDEANFTGATGGTEEVRNPASGLYRWNLKEVLQAIRDGIAHGFSMSNLFGHSAISATRFKDEELGKKVAAETLKNFDGYEEKFLP